MARAITWTAGTLALAIGCAHPPITRPRPPPEGALVGEGEGRTPESARSNALHAVSAKVRAAVLSRSETTFREVVCRRDGGDCGHEIRETFGRETVISTCFAHADLIHVDPPEESAGGYRVVAWLERDAALARYDRELSVWEADLGAAFDEIERAAASGDDGALAATCGEDIASKAAEYETRLRERSVIAGGGYSAASPRLLARAVGLLRRRALRLSRLAWRVRVVGIKGQLATRAAKLVAARLRSAGLSVSTDGTFELAITVTTDDRRAEEYAFTRAQAADSRFKRPIWPQPQVITAAKRRSPRSRSSRCACPPRPAAPAPWAAPPPAPPRPTPAPSRS